MVQWSVLIECLELAGVCVWREGNGRARFLARVLSKDGNANVDYLFIY